MQRSPTLVLVALLASAVTVFAGGWADASPTSSGQTEGATGRPDPVWTVHARPIGSYRPTLTVGRMARSDGLPRPVVRRLVRKALAPAARCYERALDAQPAAGATLAGTLQIRLIVTVHGRVAHAAVTGFAHDDVQGCMAAVLRRMHFPEPRSCGVAMVQLGIELRPNIPARWEAASTDGVGSQ